MLFWHFLEYVAQKSDNPWLQSKLHSKTRTNVLPKLSFLHKRWSDCKRLVSSCYFKLQSLKIWTSNNQINWITEDHQSQTNACSTKPFWYFPPSKRERERERERETHAASLRRRDILTWTSFLPLFFRGVQGTKITPCGHTIFHKNLPLPWFLP